MPNLQTIRTGIAELPAGSPLVVVLVGATTGIGSYVAKAWATVFAKHGFKLRVYIVGRNAARAETLLQYGRETSPGSEWRFVQASDLSLMSKVDEISQRIIQQEEESPFAGGPARIDVLYLSQAQSPVQASPSTSILSCPMLFFLITRSLIRRPRHPIGPAVLFPYALHPEPHAPPACLTQYCARDIYICRQHGRQHRPQRNPHRHPTTRKIRYHKRTKEHHLHENFLLRGAC